jgi:uncharacterized protein YjbI with pentapeptide repeats
VNDPPSNEEQQQLQQQQPRRDGLPPGWRYYDQAKHHSRLRGWLAQVWGGAKNNAALLSLVGVLLTLLVTTVLTQLEWSRQQALENQRAVQQRNVENQRAEAERELAEQQAQQEALQTYLGDMGELILHETSPLREASGGDEVSRLARAKTLTVLLGLDGGRERILLQFLKEEALINAHKPIVSLSGADLSSANLSGADLSDVALNDADLRDANLSCLVEETPQGVFKTCVNLSDSDLSGANLRGANLSSANLSGAELIEVNLEDAILSNVVLSNADLSGALGVTQEELLSAESLEGATMPNGSKWLSQRTSQKAD